MRKTEVLRELRKRACKDSIKWVSRQSSVRAAWEKLARNGRHPKPTELSNRREQWRCWLQQVLNLHKDSMARAERDLRCHSEPVTWPVLRAAMREKWDLK